MAFFQQQRVTIALLLAAAAAFALLPRAAVAPPQAAPLLACLPAQADAEESVLDTAQQALVDYLTRRFQIAVEPTERIVGTAYAAAAQFGLDPFLVLAVISVESRFNPIAESGMGARGLMQIIPRYHREKLARHGGDDAALDPESNIRVGAQILREYVRRTGSLVAGLQYYNGASWDEEARYTQKVLAERERLARAARTGGVY